MKHGTLNLNKIKLHYGKSYVLFARLVKTRSLCEVLVISRFASRSAYNGKRLVGTYQKLLKLVVIGKGKNISRLFYMRAVAFGCVLQA